MIHGLEFPSLEQAPCLDENKIAYFVIGQEGSGTYMLHNAIAEVVEEPDIVTRRSVPHAHEWPQLTFDLGELVVHGYKVVPIVIMREMMATLNSVNDRDATRILQPLDYYRRLAYIMFQLDFFERSCHFITYEAFVTSEFFRRAFFDRIGLDYPENFQFYNANDKYYGEK